MDWTKYPLEKLFSFVAGIILGSVALLMFPGRIEWFFALGFLGYRTKLALFILVAFVVGFTATTFLGAILGGIGEAIGAASYNPPYSYEIALWRDPKWRELVKKRVGAGCPNTRPMSALVVELRSKIAASLPQDQQAAAIMALHGERLAAESDDLNWSVWYDHYHRIILEPSKDVVWHVHTGLTFSLETAAVVVLLSAALVPSVRHWWWILPSLIWLLLLIVEAVVTVQKAADKWSTLSDQVKYLSTDDLKGPQS